MATADGSRRVGGSRKGAVGRGILSSSSQRPHPLQRPQQSQSWRCSQGTFHSTTKSTITYTLLLSFKID